MEPATKKPRVMPGPLVWWVRNDLRIQDNPALRAVNGAALCDKRPFVAVFVFDRRTLDESKHGYSITDFSGKNTKGLHARFVRQGVLALRKELEACGSKLLVCQGKPEEVFLGLPSGTEMKCQNDHFNASDVECARSVERAVNAKGSKLRRDFGATGLYHWHELPFSPQDKPDWYTGLAGLSKVLGWKDIQSSTERNDNAAPIRPVVPAPSRFSPPPEGFQLPGLVSDDVFNDESKMLQLLGYTAAEIKEAQAQEILEGGEPAARALLEEWDAKKDWATAFPKFVNYMMMGCISAREIFAHSGEKPNQTEVVQQLLWRDFHRLHNEPEEKGALLSKASGGADEITMMKEQMKKMKNELDELRQGRA